MRAAITFIVTLFILAAISLVAEAQVTAVMQAKVNIVSGAGLIAMHQPKIDLAAASTNGGTIDAGRFSFVASPGADVSVHISKKSRIVNAKGDHLSFTPSIIHHTDDKTGEHEIIMQGSLRPQATPSGHYKGQITAVIEYL